MYVMSSGWSVSNSTLPEDASKRGENRHECPCQHHYRHIQLAIQICTMGDEFVSKLIQTRPNSVTVVVIGEG